MCVSQSVCLSVCLSVQAITFEPIDIETSFVVWWYILTISRSSLSIKVIGSSSGSIFSLTQFDLSEVKVIPWSLGQGQGQGHFMKNANLAPGHQFNLV